MAVAIRKEVDNTLPWNYEQVDDNGPYINWNSAEVRGQQSAAFDALMEQNVRVTLGNQYVKPYPRGKRSTAPGAWAAIEGPWRALAEGEGPRKENNREGWGLTTHWKGDRKDGMGYVLGVSANGSREKLAMRDMAAMGLDLDEGADIEAVVQAVEETGWACFLYTSYNHMKTTIDVSYSAIHATAKGEPFSDEMVRAHLHRKKPALGEAFIELVTIREEKVDIGDGFVVRCDCPPIHKMRLIFPFAEPINIAELDDDPAKGPDVWKDKVKGLAAKLGVHHDRACEDPSRLFYTARHRPEDEDFECIVFRGAPLSWEDIPTSAGDPWSQAGQGLGGSSIPEGVMFGDVSITDLYRRYGMRWNIADILEGTDAHIEWTSTGKSHVDCAYRELNHTNKAKDRATIAVNAADSHSGFAVVSCEHESCKTSNNHIVYQLKQWLEDSVLTVDVLEDPAFMEPLPDSGEEAFTRLTPLESIGTSEALAYFREHGHDADADTIIRQIVDMGGEAQYARERVEEARETVKRQLDGWNTDKSSNPVAEVRREISPVPSQEDFKSPDLLGDLHDPDWINESGFMVSIAKNPGVYGRYGIAPEMELADAMGRRELKAQIAAAMMQRFSWVVIDGQAKVAMRQGPGKPVKLWKDTTLDKLYRNRWVGYEGPKGGVHHIKPHEVFAGARERPTYVDTCFEPDPAKAPPHAYNLWTGFAVEPREGEWPRMREHIRRILCNDDEQCYLFTMTYLASLFQRPGTKIPSSLAFIGEQGTGKSKVFDWVRRAIGSAALKVSSARHLTGNFNAHLDGKIFLTCEEAFWAGDKAAEGPLKDIISSDTLPIEGKFENVVERPNYVNPVFISNNDWIVPTDGEDARRFLVQRVSNAQKQNGPYFGAIDDEMENGGLEAMVYDLMHWDPSVIGGWDGLRNPPKTDVLREQAGLSLEGPAAILMDIICDGFVTGRMRDGTTFHYALKKSEPTVVADPHLKVLLNPQGGRGNIAKAANKAIVDLLGADASSGEHKAQVKYQTSSLDNTVAETNDRVRTITFPSLDDLKVVRQRYGH